jgi:hypothetical protein
VPNVDVVEEQILGMEGWWIEETIGLLPGDRRVRQVAVVKSSRSRRFFRQTKRGSGPVDAVAVVAPGRGAVRS